MVLLLKITCLFSLALAGSTAVQATEPAIDVVYPKSGQRVWAVDSTFIFGNVTPGSNLSINGTPVDVHRNGAFLAYLPIEIRQGWTRD